MAAQAETDKTVLNKKHENADSKAKGTMMIGYVLLQWENFSLAAAFGSFRMRHMVWYRDCLELEHVMKSVKQAKQVSQGFLMKHVIINLHHENVRRVVLYWRTDAVLAQRGMSVSTDNNVQAKMAGIHRTIAAGKLVGEIRKWRRHVMMSSWHYFRQHFVEAAALKAAMVWASVAKQHARDMGEKANEGGKAKVTRAGPILRPFSASLTLTLKSIGRVLRDRLGRTVLRYIFIWHMKTISDDTRNVFATKGIEHHDHSHDDVSPSSSGLLHKT